MENSSQLLMGGWGAVTSPSTRSWNTLPNEAYLRTLPSTSSYSQPQVEAEGRVFGADSNSSPNSDSRQEEATSRWGKTTPKKKKITDKKYRRYEKPPYSYVGLIALAIQSSSSKMLKLSEILSRISTMFPFFKGEYQGWRDSVRHNLSQNKCFKKVLSDPHRPQSKGNYWTVDVSEIPAEKLKRQNTAVSRNVAPGYAYARDLNDIFDMSTGKLKVSSAVGSQHGFNTEAMDTFFSDNTTPSNLLSEQAIAASNPFAYPPCTQVPINYEVPRQAQYNGKVSQPLQTSTTSPKLANANSAIHTNGSKAAPSPGETDASDISDADDQASSDESSVPTDSSDDSRGAEDNDAALGRCKSRRNKRKRAVRRQHKKARARGVQSKCNDVDNQPKPPPPNQKPFGDNHTHLAKTARDGGANRSVLWSSIDQTVGPDGPPNVTWTSSTSLNEVRPFFEPPTSQFEAGSGQWPVDVTGDVSAPAQAEPNVENKTAPLFADQTDFLTEQAAILPGRHGDHFSHPGVNHGFCAGFGASAVSGSAPHDPQNVLTRVEGNTNLLMPPLGLPLDPLAGNLSHSTTPYLNSLDGSSSYGLDKRYPSCDDPGLLHLGQGYGWPNASAPFSDWMCSSFIPHGL